LNFLIGKKDEKIMILGAGIYQVPLILKAKELGIYTIVVSIRGNYPGFNFADKCYFLDTRDFEGILEAASNEKIDGIITTGTDVAVKAIGYVNDKLGLSGISYRAAELSTDKALMKDAFVKGGVKSAEYSKVDTIEDALTF
jgi:phosphoribosylaminoimidazole carboxylase (NCAIR synthetase)